MRFITHKTPDKMCVVFDCSVSFEGESLNSHLLQGPDLINYLVCCVGLDRNQLQ